MLLPYAIIAVPDRVGAGRPLTVTVTVVAVVLPQLLVAVSV